ATHLLISVERWCFFFQAEDGIRDFHVTGVQTCALPICRPATCATSARPPRAERARGSRLPRSSRSPPALHTFARPAARRTRSAVLADRPAFCPCPTSRARGTARSASE